MKEKERYFCNFVRGNIEVGDGLCFQDNTPTSPSYPKSPPLAPKPARKQDDPPELPPTSTHPLYNASMGEPPKMAFYPSGNVSNKGPARDPWQREEQERQAEVKPYPQINKTTFIFNANFVLGFSNFFFNNVQTL